MSDGKKAEESQEPTWDDVRKWNEERAERLEEARERIGFTGDGTE